MNSGLSAHVGNVWRMIHRANCEDGSVKHCLTTKTLEDLSDEIVQELEVIASCQNCKQCKKNQGAS